jgi:vacuolar iron transporter family protein
VNETILGFQKGEITEHHIYGRLARVADPKNARVLERLSRDEARHYREWKKLSGRDAKPDRLKIVWYTLLSRMLGLTFVVKLMESGEQGAQDKYSRVVKKYPVAKKIVKEELEHEKLLVAMIDEEKVKHLGSMVLGINDALVEITGTLAGLTFALQNSSLVGLAGLITGISATLSMGASEYLSQRSEGNKDALRAAGYTGAAYMMSVALLVLPYFVFANPFLSLATALADALIVIFIFSFFSSVIKEESFRRNFLEMASISMGVALLSFLIGILVRNVLNITG